MELNSAVIQVFLPKDIPTAGGTTLYGIRRQESKDKLATSSFYVLKASKKVSSNLSALGVITRESDLTNRPRSLQGINLIEDSRGQIVKVLLDGKVPKSQVILLRFDRNRFLKCYDEEYNADSINENFSLFIAKSLKDEQEKMNGNSTASKLLSSSHNLLKGFTSAASTVLQPIAILFRNTVIYRHCCNWRKCLSDQPKRNDFILLDVLLGVLFFLLMNHIQHSGKYFMISTEFIVNKLRTLLDMLDGSPAGLKLNVQLNNFLLGCFMYHVDLWWNFIRIVEPAIQYLFVPIAMFGLMGFSFQCAMLCDLVTLITLHAHCFYIYAAMLYKLELSSIRSLWRIVLGRRLNVLKSKRKVAFREI